MRIVRFHLTYRGSVYSVSLIEMASKLSIFLITLFTSLNGGFAWRVTACLNVDHKPPCSVLQGSGCMNVGLHDDDTIMNDRIKSINTHGGCVRAYGDANCFGKSRAYYVGSPEWVAHHDLSQTKFENFISSFGPCFPNECALKGGKIVDNCTFHDVVWVGGWKPGLVTKEMKEKGNPIIKYQTGVKDRLEYVRAQVFPNHLDTGVDPDGEMLQYVRSIGRPTDVVGLVVPKILGGSGLLKYNVFPQNEKVKIPFDRMIYDVVKSQGWSDLEINLHYDTDESTRPSVIIYRIHSVRYYRMRDFINPL